MPSNRKEYTNKDRNLKEISNKIKYKLKEKYKLSKYKLLKSIGNNLKIRPKNKARHWLKVKKRWKNQENQKNQKNLYDGLLNRNKK